MRVGNYIRRKLYKNNGWVWEVTTKELARLVSNLNEVKFVEEVSGVN